MAVARMAGHDRVDEVLRGALARLPRLRPWFSHLGRTCRVRHDAQRHCFDITIGGPVLTLLLGGFLGLLVLVASSDPPGTEDLMPSTARLRVLPAHPQVLEVADVER
jgi:hypothetical protein